MKLSALLLAVLFASASAFAADGENTDTTTVDNSHNPITGSHTKKVKHHHKKKNMDGVDVDHTSTETTKVKKDGAVKKDTKVEDEKVAH